MRLAIWACEFALYICLFIGVGGAVFLRWFGETTRTASRFVRSSLVIGLGVAPLFFLVQERNSVGNWRDMFSSPEGATAILAEAAFFGGLAALALKNSLGKAFALLALLGVGIALAASGNASAAEPRWMTQPAVFVHVVGITLWAGALLPLAAALNSNNRHATNALRCFSHFIPWAVLPLIAAGFVLALLQLGTLASLWTTPYGRVLLLKLVLFVVLLALAVFNRFWLTEAVERRDSQAVTWLRRTIAIEVALILLIFAVAVLWRFTPTPQAQASSSWT